ncbi:MAG: hypothetical protein FD129_2793, partial [bacterium]
PRWLETGCHLSLGSRTGRNNMTWDLRELRESGPVSGLPARHDMKYGAYRPEIAMAPFWVGSVMVNTAVTPVIGVLARPVAVIVRRPLATPVRA